MLKEYVRFGLEHWGSDQQGVNNTRRYLLEWLSFLHRYIPVGLLGQVGVLNEQKMNQRLSVHVVCGRSDLETLFLSPHSEDWIKISELLLGPVPEGFQFEPKHETKG
jgi:tRNA-dihydrouridine synthase 3